MNLTLDYNVELFPLQTDQNFALALASSLARGAPPANADGEDAERDVWRPDGKGNRGLDDEYDYVMYGKVRPPYTSRCVPYSRACHSHQIYKFDAGSGEIV